MKTLLINPPYQTITSNWGVGHHVPLGLLMIGGPARDAGLDVELLDAEARRMSLSDVADYVRRLRPDVVMTGHAGSTPAHPVCMDMLAEIKRVHPQVICAYGGVFPTYHDTAVLNDNPQVDVIVRGEGEATTTDLLAALSDGATSDLQRLSGIAGVTYRAGHDIVRNAPRPVIRDLGSQRVAWELVDDWDLHQCYGRGRAAMVQLSRGCPHRCTYCGQHGFWVKWRYRDPEALAREIKWLHDRHDVRFVTLTDENPTTVKSVWRRFLETMADQQVDVEFFATIRASDIVRDADIVDKYRQAGIRHVLMGIDTTDPDTIKQIRKRSTTADDLEACRLLRENDIHPMIGHIVGFGDETWTDIRRAGKALAMYDGDYLNAMYVTPHSWTQFADEQADRRVIQEDQLRWDYRHQVLEQRHLRPWQLFAAVKWLELRFHLRPRRLRRLFCHRDRTRRREAWWTARHTTMVWLMEIVEFVRHVRFARAPAPLNTRAPVRGQPNVHPVSRMSDSSPTGKLTG